MASYESMLDNLENLGAISPAQWRAIHRKLEAEGKHFNRRTRGGVRRRRPQYGKQRRTGTYATRSGKYARQERAGGKSMARPTVRSVRAYRTTNRRKSTKKDYLNEIFALTFAQSRRWMRTMASTGQTGKRIRLTSRNYQNWSLRQLANRANSIKKAIRMGITEKRGQTVKKKSR